MREEGSGAIRGHKVSRAARFDGCTVEKWIAHPDSRSLAQPHHCDLDAVHRRASAHIGLLPRIERIDVDAVGLTLGPTGLVAERDAAHVECLMAMRSYDY